MTKLFSMKSLAFAGAAAFALTLAVAPKADAADAKIVDAEMGEDGDIWVDVDGDLTSTEDGSVIYYQVAKDSSKLKEGKYVSVADEGRGNVFNFGKFLGKQQVLSLSTNGELTDATNIDITAAPKVKVKYNAGKQGFEAVELEIDKAKATISTGAGIQATAGSKTYNVYGLDENFDFVKKNLAFGGTVEVQVQEVIGKRKEGDPITIPSISKVAKMKISAKAKAPKAALKLDATKAFTWKISDKQQYIIKLQGSDQKVDWADGSNAAANWATIVGAVKNDDLKDIVTGDAITKDITISLRTKATEKKAASAINVISLKKSAASPTSGAISVETTKAANPDKNGKFKTVTGASIKATADTLNLQYSTDGGAKWKKLSTKAQKLKTGETNVLVRVVTPSKNAIVLPSLNTGVTWDTETGVATISPFDYSGDTVAAATAETVQPK